MIEASHTPDSNSRARSAALIEPLRLRRFETGHQCPQN